MDTQVPSHPQDLTPSAHWADIRMLIVDRFGLYFCGHEAIRLHEAVRRRMTHLDIRDAGQYYDRLQESDAEFRELLHLLTVRHAYFFHHELQFRALRDRVLPALIERKQTQGTPRPCLRIWSAGCAGGEEPYSLAITAGEALADRDDWDVSILATDVSALSLAGAQSGLFGPRSMSLLPRQQRRRYFQHCDERAGRPRYRVQETLRQRVTFRYLNLLSDDYPRDIDLIFCRNILTELDEEIMENVIHRFYRSLNSPGYLFLGYRETLEGFSSPFACRRDRDGVHYCKVADAGARPSGGSAATQISTAEARVSTAPISQAGGSLLRAIGAAFEDQDYPQSLSLIQQVDPRSPEAVEAFYQAAYSHIDRGAYEAALRWLDRLLALDASFAPAYFLRGVIRIEQGRHDEAQSQLSKALYLDHEFPPAHMAMATCHHRQGRIEDARRAYRRALRLLTASPPTRRMHHAGGADHQTLSAICRRQLEQLPNPA
jgi:chemotaxis protein methyltransferase CheR